MQRQAPCLFMSSAAPRRPLPLRHFIPLVVLGFCVVWTVVFTLVHVAMEKRRAAQVVINRSSTIAERHAGYVRNADDLPTQEEFVRMARARGQHWALICDGQMKIQYSTQEDWVGMALQDNLTPECMAMVRESARTLQPMKLVGQDGEAWAVHPVTEADGRTLRWLSVLEVDLSRAFQLGCKEAWRHALVAGLVQVAGCLLLWWLLRWVMRRRLSQLIATENTLLLQALGAKPEVDSRTDELSEIVRILKESGNRLDQLADNIEDILFVSNPDKKLVYINGACSRIFGISPAEMVNNPESWRDAVLPEYHDMLWHISDPLLDGAPEVHGEFRIRGSDGKTRWVELRMFPVRDERGRLINLAGLSRDVTDRKELEQEILNVSERERRKLGADIHDDLCQSLAGIKLKCEDLAADLREAGSPLAARATETFRLMADATRRSRDIAQGLSPIELEGEGFAVGIDKLVKATESLHDIPCFFYCPEPVVVENPTAAVHLYRITQEFLNNAVRHGKPSSIEVRLEMNAQYVRIEVTNDGAPYPRQPQPGPGMGLKIQRYRAEAIGAQIKIQARSDGVDGTVATCIAPHSACNPDLPSPP